MAAATVVSIGLAAAASAQTVTIQPTGMQTQRVGNVDYLSGGVGEHERAAIRSMGNDYNLKIVTGLDSGSYLDDVQLTIRDAAGTAIVDTSTDGPLFYAKLPPGQYTVEARADGRVAQRTLNVGSGTAPETFMRMGPGIATAGDPKPTAEEAQGMVSLYNLDPTASQAQAQVNTYEVYPDGTTRRVDPSAVRPQLPPDDAVIIHIEPVPEPGAVPLPPSVGPDGQL
jgi:hypothetical protein